MSTYLLILIGVCLASCTQKLEPIDSGEFSEWQVLEATDSGIDTVKLQKAWDYAFQPKMNTQGIVVIKDGYIIAEKYADDSDVSAWANSWSIGKSMASALIGIAWTDGKLTDLDHSIARYVTDWVDTDYENISLRDVLTMSSGISWNEEYLTEDSSDSDAAILVLEELPMDVVINQPLLNSPGEVFNYSSADAMLLSLVVTKLHGENPTAVANKRLVKQLNFQKFDWWEDGVGNTFTFCCVDATIRDFAKFGQLYLQRGSWGGEQLLSEEWVNMTTTVTANAYDGYGLQWWLNPADALEYPDLPASAYFALGHNGQYVGVFPDQNMVIARFGTYEKPEGPAVTDKGLFAGGIWSDGIGPTGTVGPDESWDDNAFFRMILDAAEAALQ